MINPLYKLSFQFYNLFRAKKTCAMNANSKIKKFPKSITIWLEIRKQTLAIFSAHIEIEVALHLEQKKLWWKDNGMNNRKRKYLAPWDRSYNTILSLPVLLVKKFYYLRFSV